MLPKKRGAHCTLSVFRYLLPFNWEALLGEEHLNWCWYLLPSLWVFAISFHNDLCQSAEGPVQLQERLSKGNLLTRGQVCLGISSLALNQIWVFHSGMQLVHGRKGIERQSLVLSASQQVVHVKLGVRHASIVGCGFVRNSFCYVEVCSLHVHFDKSGIMNGCWIYQMLFLHVELIMWFSLFICWCAVSHWFLYVELIFWPWDESNLIVVYDFF